MITVKAKNNFNNEIPSFSGDQYYVPVVDGKESNQCAETEDVALLLGLGIKYDGVNSQFAKMACRMLNIKTCWVK
jgi:hypothetical protein